MSDATLGLAILGIIAAIVGGPLALIWAANAVFALAIPYTLKTWFGMLVLWVLLAGNGRATCKGK